MVKAKVERIIVSCKFDEIIFFDAMLTNEQYKEYTEKKSQIKFGMLPKLGSGSRVFHLFYISKTLNFVEPC